MFCTVHRISFLTFSTELQYLSLNNVNIIFWTWYLSSSPGGFLQGKLFWSQWLHCSSSAEGFLPVLRPRWWTRTHLLSTSCQGDYPPLHWWRFFREGKLNYFLAPRKHLSTLKGMTGPPPTHRPFVRGEEHAEQEACRSPGDIFMLFFFKPVCLFHPFDYSFWEPQAHNYSSSMTAWHSISRHNIGSLGCCVMFLQQPVTFIGRYVL